MAIRPKNFEEVMRFKRCLAMKANISEIDDELVEKMYHFIGEDPRNKVCASGNLLSFVDVAGTVVFSLALASTLHHITSAEMTGISLSILRPASYSGGDGGVSGNNNNNNNNNNNG